MREPGTEADLDALVEELLEWQRYSGFVEHEEVFFGAATGHEYRSKQMTPTQINQPKPLMNKAATARSCSQ